MRTLLISIALSAALSVMLGGAGAGQLSSGGHAGAEPAPVAASGY